MTDLHMDLLENGIDFIRSGIETFYAVDEPTPRHHKYAILHLFAGTLLVLKERLRREHDSLIFTRVEEMTKVDAKTVDFDTLISRLRGCASLKLDEKETKFLTNVQKTRNRLEHYRLEMNLHESEALIADLCEFIYLFLREHLDTRLEQHLEGEAWWKVQELRKIAAKLHEERVAERKARATNYREMSSEELESLLRDSYFHPKHNPDGRGPTVCEICGEETVVVVESDIAICTNTECRETFHVGECWRCSHVMVGSEDGFCDWCQDAIDDE